ncbi:MAG: hypothetical protein L3J42_07530 [Hydrogenimonas sp.]|nr:hypothetical protein [Hydrogenimonas sp.]
MSRGVKTSLFFVLVLFFIGCESGVQKAGIMEREQNKIGYANTILKRDEMVGDQELKKAELQTQKEIAKLQMQKAIEVEKIKAEAKKSEVLSRKEIAMREAELKERELEKRSSSDNWFMIIGTLFLAALLLLLYKIFREHQRTKLQLHKERMVHEAAIREKELQAKIIEKMLDAVGEGKLTPEQHEKLLESMSGRRLTRR